MFSLLHPRSCLNALHLSFHLHHSTEFILVKITNSHHIVQSCAHFSVFILPISLQHGFWASTFLGFPFLSGLFSGFSAESFSLPTFCSSLPSLTNWVVSSSPWYAGISQIYRSSPHLSRVNSRVSYLCVYLMSVWMFNKHLKLDMSSACKLLQTCSSSSIPHFCKRPNILKLTLTYLPLTYPTFSLSANPVSYRFKFIQK